VAYKGKRQGKKRILDGKHGQQSPLQDLNIDGRIILKFILNTSVERAPTGLTWFRIGIGDGLL
jgi:hypothetical protein